MSEHVLPQPDDPVAATLRQPRSGFDTEAPRGDRKVVLRLHGELDVATAPALARAVNSALDGRPAAVTLDLREVTFVDSTGLGVFVAGHRRAAGNGSLFVLRSPASAVLRTLQLTGLDQLLHIDLGNMSCSPSDGVRVHAAPASSGPSKARRPVLSVAPACAVPDLPPHPGRGPRRKNPSASGGLSEAPSLGMWR